MKIRLLSGVIVMFGLATLTSWATESLLLQANAWSAGQPIPQEWLAYRKTAPGAAYVPAPDDSGTIIAAITNKPLLVEMLFQTDIDDRVFAAVVDRALHWTGPQ